jgi:hypothetical protein
MIEHAYFHLATVIGQRFTGKERAAWLAWLETVRCARARGDLVGTGAQQFPARELRGH